MISFITDIQSPSEGDILSSVKNQQLRIQDLSGSEIETINAPREGWSHEDLLHIAKELAPQTFQGAEAFLGTTWVGSTEV